MGDGNNIHFSGKFKFLLGVGIFITGTLGTIVNFVFLSYGIKERIWIEMGTNRFVNTGLLYMAMLFIFISLVMIAASKRPFSAIVTRCMTAIGIMYAGAGIISPWLPGFKDTGFQFMALTSEWYIEGTSFTLGILFIILGKIMKYGYAYQQEIDTLL